MERIYINRDCCLAYVVIALHCIYHSANKEISIIELVEEIKTLFEIYTDEIELKKLMGDILLEEGTNKIVIKDENNDKVYKYFSLKKK